MAYNKPVILFQLRAPFSQSVAIICTISDHPFHSLHSSCRQALMSQRGSDSDKLNPTLVTSSRAPSHLNAQSRQDVMDDDDKLLDVVGPPQSPMLPLGHPLAQMHGHPHSGELTVCHQK